MIEVRQRLMSFEAKRDLQVRCNLEIQLNGGTLELFESELIKLATDAYIVKDGTRVPRRGLIREVLAGETTWAMKGLRMAPARCEGELALIFEKPRSDETLTIELWAAGAKPGFDQLIIELPRRFDLLRQNVVLAERFTFWPEMQDGREVVTMKCDGDPEAVYYPYYCLGDYADERCVVRKTTRPLQEARQYDII